MMSANVPRQPGSPVMTHVPAKGLVLTVDPGEDVSEALRSFLNDSGVRCATFVLISGLAARLSLYTGKPTKPGSRQVAEFSGPHSVKCPATLVSGSGTFGRGGSPGDRVLHCHAIFCDADGHLLGCHLSEGDCIAGGRGIEIAVFPTDPAGFERRHDPVTDFEIFFPLAGDKG